MAYNVHMSEHFNDLKNIYLYCDFNKGIKVTHINFFPLIYFLYRSVKLLEGLPAYWN